VLLAVPPAVAGARDAYVHLTVDDPAELEVLTRLVSITDVRGSEVRAYASPEQLVGLREAGYSWEVLPELKRARIVSMCPTGWEDDPGRTWDCYPRYSQYVAMMQDFSTDYPEICRLETIGASTNQVRPHDLWVVKISDNPDLEEDEPEVFYTSSMHGDETLGWVLTLRLVDELLSGYGSDPELTAMVDELEIWINPLANPDGTYYGSDSNVSSAIRGYVTTTGAYTGVDPNRNFPDPDDGDHPDGNAWWAETVAMMDFALAHQFVISANFHGGAEVVNYPWDTWSRRHPDDDWFIDVSHAYADAAQAASPPGYMAGFNDGITNGWDWYPVAGGRQDFMTYWAGCRETTIELSNVKLLSSSLLEAHWGYNRQALLNYLKEALEGVRGLVRDPLAQPLDATVEVLGYDTAADNSYVFTDPDTGDYHRLLLPGIYRMRFSADGFLPQELPFVMINAGDATRVDMVLQPLVSHTVTGLVTTPGVRAPVTGATVELLDTLLPEVTTSGDGSYAITGVPESTYTFRVAAAGYEVLEAAREVTAEATRFDFVLTPSELIFEDGFESGDTSAWSGIVE
ncbi:MAG: hypothetical protein GY856_39960, partial [bacterium]|nr:hypothetical protein [bacterium]